MRFDTRLLHDGPPTDPATGGVNPPIVLSSTFAQSAPNRNKGYVYSRSGNPTRAQLEALLARLEGGHTGLAFSSGLGALATLLEHFPTGSRIVAGDDLYGGTWRLLEHHRRQFGIVPVYVDTRDTRLVAHELARAPTAMLYLETPSNPLLRLADIAALSRAAHARRAIVAVDNTFATPALQRPLELGADVVLHSTTKYLGGHSDIIGGALIARRRALGARLAWLQNAVGAVPSPVDCFLVVRGIRTLGVRMRQHEIGARAVAETLARSPKVRSVHYPGLASEPQRSLARRQMSGGGGMLSADLRGGQKAALRFLRALRVFTLAESLGGVESLIDHPASMTHASVPRAEREAHGVGDGLLRFSCGIEDAADLVEDVAGALRRV
ncbi:MAG TPA: PLP-dependent aspartate aminotransferase family protein [Thermoplasmata archaeon]|nr:PLP-dependent aspartate aminotransferase family protein [Thermoplasmata archaeon]